MKINIGSNIKRLRTARSVTQEQLAETMNVSCAAVSNWARGESSPDITLLKPLAYYFGVSLDELMGYDKEKVSEDIERMLEEYGKYGMSDRARAREIITKAYREYPNDYQIMDAYMWEIAGSYADNDPSVLLEHKDEFLGICDKLIEGCTWERARIDAWNMKAKILHAEGKTDEAKKIYMTRFTTWYQTGTQKIEQLYSKDAPEYLYWVRFNMYGLADFAADKLVKTYYFDKSKSYEMTVGTVERFGDVLYGIAQESGETFFLVQARSIYGRLYNDLKNRGGEDGDVIRTFDKFLMTTEKLVKAAKTDKSLFDAFISYQNTDDYLQWIIDYYTNAKNQRNDELRKNPEYIAVLEKYRMKRVYNLS